MEVDSTETRGVKRSAADAGLPPEAPRRIRVSSAYVPLEELSRTKENNRLSTQMS